MDRYFIARALLAFILTGSAMAQATLSLEAVVTTAERHPSIDVVRSRSAAATAAAKSSVSG